MVYPFGVRNEKSFSLWVQYGEIACRIVNHKIFFRQTVRKMFSEERQHVILGMNLREEDAVL